MPRTYTEQSRRPGLYSYGLYRAPPRSQGPRSSRGLFCWALSGSIRAERCLELERRRGLQKPLAAAQEKWFPVRFPYVWRGTVYLAGGNPECGQRRAGIPWSWAAQGALGVRCILVANVQGEMVQGSA
jgi:hypothetical protein